VFTAPASTSFDVVFSQLTGDVTAAPINIVFTDGAIHTASVSINAEGQINW